MNLKLMPLGVLDTFPFLRLEDSLKKELLTIRS